MKKRKSALRLLSVVMAAGLLLSGCHSAEKEKTPAIQITVPELVPKGRSFVLPEGAAYIAMPEDPGPDDFLTFNREFEAALAARKAVICTSGRVPLDWADLCAMDYGVFWLKSYSYSLEWAIPEGEKEEKNIYTYHLQYFDLSESDIQRMKREIDAEVARIFALFPADADKWTQARIVHDELVKTVSYDEDKESVYYFNPYGALVRHKAVCQGYASAFTFLMSRAGVYSTFTASETHGWNSMSALLSYEEYIDCTWDDPDLNDANGQPYVFHDHFFLTKEEMESLEDHDVGKGGLPSVTFYGETEHANYFYHEGYLLRSFDAGALAEIYRQQLQAGNNLLEARFETEEAYRRALALLDGDGRELSDIVARAGYDGAFYYFTNEQIRTLSIGLYPPNA